MVVYGMRRVKVSIINHKSFRLEIVLHFRLCHGIIGAEIVPNNNKTCMYSRAMKGWDV